MRLHALKPTTTTHAGVPLDFTFLGAGTTLPLSLVPRVPSQPVSHSILSSPSSVHFHASHASSSGQHRDAAAANHHDMFVSLFEPQDRTDVLLPSCHCFQHALREDFGVMTRAPSASIAQARQLSALSKMMEGTELTAQDVVVTAWDLRPEAQRGLEGDQAGSPARAGVAVVHYTFSHHRLRCCPTVFNSTYSTSIPHRTWFRVSNCRYARARPCQIRHTSPVSSRSRGLPTLL